MCWSVVDVVLMRFKRPGPVYSSVFSSLFIRFNEKYSVRLMQRDVAWLAGGEDLGQLHMEPLLFTGVGLTGAARSFYTILEQTQKSGFVLCVSSSKWFHCSVW